MMVFNSLSYVTDVSSISILNFCFQENGVQAFDKSGYVITQVHEIVVFNHDDVFCYDRKLLSFKIFI